MSERIRVVLSDVDATQIIPGQKLPSPRVQAAAQGLRKNNVYLSEVTSRSHLLIQNLVEPLDLQDNLCVLDGGATVARANTGEIVWSNWLSAELTESVVTSIGEFCTRLHFDRVSRRKSREEVLSMVANNGIDSEGRPSVFAIFDATASEDILSALGGIVGVSHTPVMGYNDIETLRCIQVVSPGVDKRVGIEQMLRIADLHDARPLGIFDGTNDFALAAAVKAHGGINVAMGNAPDELKDLAHWVAPSVVEDGFAVAMQHFGLIG